LLDVTRLESGHVRPKFYWCDVGDLIQTTTRSIQPELSGREIKIEIAKELPLARLDFTLMQQAVANLLLNIAVHTPAGTPILLQMQHQEGQLILTISDRGPGLPPESLPRIFDKFFRGPGAPAGGSGLGLAIVKGFVEAQGGQVTAANRPNGGAVFTIRVPQSEPPPLDLAI
jgi:two-component system sensor histidine kinase KdpD